MRSIGTCRTETCVFGCPSQPVMVTPAGIVIWKPGMLGSVTARCTLLFEMSTRPVVFWKCRYGVKPSVLAWPATIVTLYGTIGKLCSGVEAGPPSMKRSWFAPAWAFCRRKFPPSSVAVCAVGAFSGPSFTTAPFTGFASSSRT